MPPSRVFILGKNIGSGGFSQVFDGTDTSTGTVCAIKKSRASLRLKRPLLKYEANIFMRLNGHLAIPKLYGYGHLKHFEYLAIELLGKSLSDKDKLEQGYSIQEVADVGVQLLSALEHIHSHGIVHRDIKPQNILACHGSTDFSHVYIIDFGLARPRLSGTPRQVDLVKERINVVGSLGWASLNAYNGIDLNPRDDLESFAFILLYLLRKNLPWHKLCRAGTTLARMRQIRSKMLSWDGTRLGEGYPSAFGSLLDYARQLGFDETIDYKRFGTVFEKLRDSEVETKRDVNPDVKPVIAIDKPPPAAPGDLVLVQIDMRASVEGDTLRKDNSSYLPNLSESLSGESWKAPFRPAIILNSELKEGGRYSFLIIPLTNLTPEGALSLKEFGVDHLPDPFSNLSAYVYPRRAIEIYSLPSQPPVCSRWKLSISTVRKLWDKLDNCSKESQPLSHLKLMDSDPDVRHDMRLRLQVIVFHANLCPLDSLLDIEIDLAGVRGWFDECVKVGRRRGWEDGFFWTGHPDEEVSLDDSYVSHDGNDGFYWDFRQQERDEELDIDIEGDVDLPFIDEVVNTTRKR